MSTSTFVEEKKEISLDKLANSGRIYKLETRQTSEQVASQTIEKMINAASKSSSSQESKKTPPLNFYVLGCGEHNTDNKKIVAELMNEVARGTKKKPDFIVILGDNFEESGVKSSNSESFINGFDKVYHAKELEAISGIPCFVIPGNHDHGFPILYPFRVTGINNDYSKISHEVNHSYVDEKGVESPAKKELLGKNTLHTEQLRKAGQTWNMPGRYYALQYENNSELFFIDSNTYVKEYIEYILKGNKNLNGQPVWLEKFAKNPETLKLLFLHHSLHTIGKRSLISDLDDYLDNDDIDRLKKNNIIKAIGTDDKGNTKYEELSYNEVLRRIMERQGLQFNAVFAAHDHAMYHFNNQDIIKRNSGSKKGILFTNPLLQVVAGGAGGDLQNRYLFDKGTSSFIKHHGFVNVEVFPGKESEILFDYYSVINPHLYNDATPELLKTYGVKGHHLRFSSKTTKPLKEAPDEKGVKELSDIVISACDEYLQKSQVTATIHKWVPTTGGLTTRVSDWVPPDVFFADDLKNYFNRFETNALESCIRYLKFILLTSANIVTKTETSKASLLSGLLTRFINGSQNKPHSLANIFFEKLRKKYDINYEQFNSLPASILKNIFIFPSNKKSLQSGLYSSTKPVVVGDKMLKDNDRLKSLPLPIRTKKTTEPSRSLSLDSKKISKHHNTHPKTSFSHPDSITHSSVQMHAISRPITVPKKAETKDSALSQNGGLFSSGSGSPGTLSMSAEFTPKRTIQTKILDNQGRTSEIVSATLSADYGNEIAKLTQSSDSTTLSSSSNDQIAPTRLSF